MEKKLQEALATYLDADRVAKQREIEIRLKALIGDARSHDAVLEIAASETRSSRFLDALLRDR
jgi:hypothetical protein